MYISDTQSNMLEVRLFFYKPDLYEAKLMY